MSDLVVRPAYQFGPTEILTAEKLNLMATPVVELALADPVNDQNFLRNGNFYSSFWTAPTGISCPVGAWTTNASYWLCQPLGAAVAFIRSTQVPDLYSLYSAGIQGAVSVGDVEFAQQINGDLSATLRRNVTFSGYINNQSGLALSPKLKIYTANAFNNFGILTLRTTVNLQTSTNLSWTYLSATIDLTSVTNVANGLLISIFMPSGTLNATTKFVLFSRLKLQIGEVATEFVDDPSLFVQAPSVDSTMLQDGCLARPGLYVTNPGVIPKGAYGAGSIQSADIGTGEIKGRNLDPGISTTTSALFTTPAVNANVAITVTSAARITAGLVLTVQGAGLYSTVNVAGSVVTAMNTGAAGNASSGTAIVSGATVTTSGNAVISGLGYTPINKAGDTNCGGLMILNDSPVGTGSYGSAGVLLQGLSANASNDGYMPGLGFLRTGRVGRAVGLDINGRFKTVDSNGVVGYLLDTVTKVGTSDIQNAAVTLAKLAAEVINMIIPPGIMSFFSGPAPPSGWFLADGSAVSRTTYAALFTAIGTYWGSGDNVSTFNLPDMRGRVPLGYVNTAVGGITARAFASKGGEETHVTTAAEMPSHVHVMNHTHGYISINAGSGIASGSGWATVAATTTDISTGMQAAGGNGAHNVMQPYSVAYWIVKY